MKSSQIYKEALNGNVMLLSWEWLYIMLEEGIAETPQVNLQDIWNQSAQIGANVTIPQQKKCFIPEQDNNMRTILSISEETVATYLCKIKQKLRIRGSEEILYYQNEIERVKGLDHDEAIKELLVRMKLDSKIETIQNFINRISDEN